MITLEQRLERQHPLPSGLSRSDTADDVLADIDLRNKRYLITGGYSGLGLEMTRALVRAGAAVVIPSRRVDAATQALSGLERVRVVESDLADLDSITRLSDHFLADGTPFDGVIASAGVMATPERRAMQGREYQFAVNHLGHFALIGGMIPLLTHHESCVVMLSSAGHFASGIRWDDIDFVAETYDPWLAYGQSKTANALFAVELAERGRQAGLRAYAVHPGNIMTPLQRHLSVQDQIALGWADNEGNPSPALRLKTPQQGASTAVWALTSPLLQDLSGIYAQDNDVAHVSTDADMVAGGVKPWALDPESASRLWEYSTAVTGIIPAL
ncbi:SDR family NAD(P)-dependent oxidoreductase [Arthrobacter sp. RCC_34]|uniref:SDR family NAD(P)-dependent oxidoreductase n=1 Tax=Arthrobacter sp. RCC_34 TaxID=3239230 RepID=UPI0035240773